MSDAHVPTDYAPSPQEFTRGWQEWRAGWERWLTQPFGWLAATSHEWLDETPRSYPGLPGLWWQAGEALHIDPQGGAMAFGGEAFTTERRFPLADAPDDVRVTLGELEVGITYRGAYLIVAYDPNSPARLGFDGVPAYEPSPRWVLPGRFEPFHAPKSITLDSVGWGTHSHDTPGVVHFEYAGTEHTLQVLSSHGMLNTVFADATSGVTTYGAGRALDIPSPNANGDVALDFNRTVNLPCAFTEHFPICPVPPPANRLPFAIEAGEKAPH
ncbi:DUF1684 domain-containing protein [Nonomuraea sp. K274]|uniref:DUF1684 domain-containing protein n=1 Tax=Nonomuraea cypriaca TaxID=1187855 RepID=A0A931AKJ0_9ACTN|nr:DUF1684 domain-containing protein [Nonomuraea cypriaca]MBF8193425.1 DUF1684 domain-containing protein [Nonomuraea cypriaca]